MSAGLISASAESLRSDHRADGRSAAECLKHGLIVSEDWELVKSKFLSVFSAARKHLPFISFTAADAAVLLHSGTDM